MPKGGEQYDKYKKVNKNGGEKTRIPDQNN